MSRTSRVFGQSTVWGIALILIGGLLGGLLGVTPAQGGAGGGELLELLARIFMAVEPGRVNINTAPAAELETRLGIEGVTARRIVAGRPYASVVDLARVGIPAETAQKIAQLITAGPMPGSTSATLGHRRPARAALADPEAVTRGMVFRDIRFDFDMSDIRQDEVDTIKDIADLMKQEPNLRAQLDGFADPRGSRAYNLRLSDRRVTVVRNALLAQGVAAPRVQIAAMGDRNRNCPEPTEKCYQRNRRVEVQIRPGGRHPAWRGIDTQFVSGAVAQTLKVPQPGGLVVKQVVEASISARLGRHGGDQFEIVEGQQIVLGGDILLTIQGIMVLAPSDMEKVRRALEALSPGQDLQVTVLRGERVLDLTTKWTGQ